MLQYNDIELFLLKLPICVGSFRVLPISFTLKKRTVTSDFKYLWFLDYVFGLIKIPVLCKRIVFCFNCLENSVEPEKVQLDYSFNMAFIFHSGAIYPKNINEDNEDFIFSTQLVSLLEEKGLLNAEATTFASVLKTGLKSLEHNLDTRLNKWLQEKFSNEKTDQESKKIINMIHTLKNNIIEPFTEKFRCCLKKENDENVVDVYQVINVIRENFSSDTIQKIKNAINMIDIKTVAPDVMIYNHASSHHQKAIDAVKHLKTGLVSKTNENVLIDGSFFFNVPVPAWMFDGIFDTRNTNKPRTENGFLLKKSSQKNTMDVGQSFTNYAISLLKNNTRTILPEIKTQISDDEIKTQISDDEDTTQEPEIKESETKKPHENNSNSFFSRISSLEKMDEIEYQRQGTYLAPICSDPKTSEFMAENSFPDFPENKWIYIKNLSRLVDNMDLVNCYFYVYFICVYLFIICFCYLFVSLFVFIYVFLSLMFNSKMIRKKYLFFRSLIRKMKKFQEYIRKTGKVKELMKVFSYGKILTKRFWGN